MNIEDIKVGETYNVRVKVDRVDTTFNAVFFTIEGGDTVYAFGVQDSKIHDLISPVIEVTGVCPPSKYDPCRKLRKGDIVEPRELYGRKHKALNYNYKYEVLEDEDKDGIVKVEYFDGGFTCTSYIPFYWFKLVTPVEELEPYFFGESENSYDLFRRTDNGNQLRTSFWWKHNPYPEKLEMTEEEAKAAAAAECARLNAEYRKEQSND